jgi:hypothetical protein
VKGCAAILVLASGCFYTDPINQRPSLDIHQITTDELFRGDSVNLEAISNDPDGDTVAYQWRAYACTTETDCDQAPFYTGIQKLAFFQIPKQRIENVGPLVIVSVTLEGHDDLGATAKPVQTLVLHVDDLAPTLELHKQPRMSYVIGTKVPLFAKVGDADDAPANVMTLDWQVFTPPTQPAYTLDPPITLPVGGDLAHLQFERDLTPNGIGDWDIQVTATDPQQLQNVQHLPLTVVADHAPCLGLWDPTASAQPSETIPISDPTLFQVLVVNDDLDPYPSSPSDPVLGTTQFAWTIVPPGGSRQALTGVTGGSVALDPASYIPGDIVELRVEIQDRNHTPVACPDNQLSCATNALEPTCTQRLSWEVEIR